MLRMARQSILDKCRPSPVLTDRRSLNRARPPPIYLQREEAITPGVFPKERVSKPFVSSDPTSLLNISPSQQNHNMLHPHPPNKKINNGKKSTSSAQYRRRVVSEDHVKDVQEQKVSPSSQKNINPLQSRLIRRSSGLKKSSSDRVASGSSTTFRTNRPLSQFQSGRNSEICNRDLVSTGYAQLRNRSISSSTKSISFDEKSDKMSRIHRRSGGSNSSLSTSFDGSATKVRLPTITSSTNLAALTQKETITTTSTSTTSNSSALKAPSPTKTVLAPLL